MERQYIDEYLGLEIGDWKVIGLRRIVDAEATYELPVEAMNQLKTVFYNQLPKAARELFAAMEQGATEGCLPLAETVMGGVRNVWQAGDNIRSSEGVFDMAITMGKEGVALLGKTTNYGFRLGTALLTAPLRQR